VAGARDGTPAVIWRDHSFITNKWRIDLSIWRIITQLATNNAHPGPLFAIVQQVPLVATAPDLLPHTTVFGGLRTPPSRPSKHITAVRFNMKVIIKWLSLHSPPN